MSVQPSNSTPSQPTATPDPSAPYPTVWIILLGLIIAVDPLSIDMYLPALPTMAQDFGVVTRWIANSVPAYFIGLVVGQLFYEPLSDRIGRIRPLYVGTVVYVVACVICATTTSVAVLFAGRTLQALGACVGSVVVRAMIRDCLNPTQMAKAFSLMTLVMGIAPILAPSLGSLLLQISSWRAIFWFLAGFGVLSLMLIKVFLQETLPPDRRHVLPLRQVLRQYVDLLKDTRFRYPALGAGLLMGSMFVYISAAPQLMMEEYGVSATHFSWIFGMNAAGFIGLTQVNQWLVGRVKLVQLLRIGALVQVSAAGTLMTLGLLFGTHAWLWAVLASIFCCIAGLGLTQPNAGAIALAFQKHRAGMASALQGSLNFIVGIFGGLLLNVFALNSVAKLGMTLFALMAVGTWLVWQIDQDLDLHHMR
ncbi:multidrug effflux MFS transporter [Faucicola atlantae]|uniref:multidrug effflux MFS transporter n=1 Tax=Faucicola atlantae TaxID=34059 RepID=UPI0025B1AF83|nr:multidrug effflux MFS transporter [Moraxella atlantae]